MNLHQNKIVLYIAWCKGLRFLFHQFILLPAFYLSICMYSFCCHSSLLDSQTVTATRKKQEKQFRANLTMTSLRLVQFYNIIILVLYFIEEKILSRRRKIISIVFLLLKIYDFNG